MRPLPWLAIAGDGAARLELGPRWGGLRLLVIGPAIASAAEGMLVTVTAGIASMAVYLAFALMARPVLRAPGSPPNVMTEATIAGVTAACALASMVRRRREAELSQAREIADITQRVLLRPVPGRAGPVRLAAWYRSAFTGAHVGGDLYEVVSTPWHVRLVIGDVEGKGLPALQAAATVLGVFREAAHQEDSLGAIADRIEASLAHQFDDRRFTTAILAQVSPDGGKVDLLNCGHPPPLLLGPARPRYIHTGATGLPLGLAALGSGPRIVVTIPLAPGEDILFYTDGITEARNKAGDFFLLADSPALRGPPDPDTLIDRLSNEVTRYVGHAPDDDAALLLIARPPCPPPAPPGIRIPRPREPS
jgi:serine phosphatase RsbU (regulator of sigma subunit)